MVDRWFVSRRVRCTAGLEGFLMTVYSYVEDIDDCVTCDKSLRVCLTQATESCRRAALFTMALVLSRR